ncbi:MAG TPA: hypothetical protein PKD91_16520, partial [Bacteroidia bacterium]|nr:hypothetical protein [Bacteroidia bacterium]
NLTFFGDFAVGERCGTTVAGTWTGALSNDWSAPENWQCGLIPNSTINVLISTGLIRYPVLSSGIGSAKNITIQTGASVTVTNATLQISGLISNSGLFNVANGTVEMNGTTAQIIPANVFSGNTISNLTTNNAAGVSLSGLLNITGILKATIGNFNTGGFVTLVSNATQSALIDGAGNGEVLGNVNMQRYLPVGFGYKYFSSPFLNATVNEFSDDLNLLSAFHPLYKYDESLSSSGWVNYSSPAGVLVPFVGYAANFGNSTAPKTVDVSGVVNNHLKTINVKNNNKPFTLGFNLVGNPYPSPIDWDAATGWTRTNVDNAVYYFDASATDQYGGSYSSYINGISSNGIAGNIIPAMQGFFVHVSNGTFPVNGSLQINNPARTTQLQPVFHRESSTDPTPLIRIETGFADFGFQNDAMVVYFDQQATVGFNKENDALKLMNTDSYIPNIYTFSSDANRLSINALPDALETIDKIPVGLKIETDGWVKFNASKIVAIPDSLNIYFVDSELRTNHDLRKTPEFRINMKKGVYETRFFLAFTEKEFPFITDTDEFGIYSYGESVFIYYNLDEGMKGEMTISNLQGQLVWKTELQHTGHFDIQPHLS